MSAGNVKTVLGIDGGATNTRALVLDETGAVVASRTAPGANHHAVGWDEVRRQLAAVTQGHRADAAFLGVAGISEAPEREALLRLAGELQLAPAGMMGVDHDIRIALAGGLAGEPGIVVIAGTGAACFGMNAVGESWRAGGWHWDFDNAGGAHRLACAGMAAVARAFDGRGPATGLSGKLPALDAVRDLSRPALAALAPVVLQAAEEGDRVAQGIVAEQAGELAQAVAAVARRLGLPGPVTYTGSLLLKSASYRAAFVAAQLPGTVVVPPRLSPAAGAVLLAARLAGWTVTPEMLGNLAKFF